MTDPSQTLADDNESLVPKPGVWVVGEREYRIKPPKLRHVAIIMRIQSAFIPLTRFDGSKAADEAMAELTDAELDKIKSADLNFEEMILELADGLTAEELDEIGFNERMDAIAVLSEKMTPADDKGLKKIGATSKKKTAASG